MVPYCPRSAIMPRWALSDPVTLGFVRLMGRQDVSRASVSRLLRTGHLSSETSVTLWAAASGNTRLLSGGRRHRRDCSLSGESRPLHGGLHDRSGNTTLGVRRMPRPRSVHHQQAPFSRFPSLLFRVTFCHRLPSPCVFWLLLGPEPVIWTPPQLSLIVDKKSKNRI